MLTADGFKKQKRINFCPPKSPHTGEGMMLNTGMEVQSALGEWGRKGLRKD